MKMTDRYAELAASLVSPASGGFAVTPHDANALAQVTRALYVGGGGDLSVEMQWGGVVTLVNVPDGALLPVRVNKVLAATTATQIVGLY
jgi:hypothetical protein